MMAVTGDFPIHCPKCDEVHGRGEYECDNSPLWPARCRGYLEGKRASAYLANAELARLRAECERLRAVLHEIGETAVNKPSREIALWVFKAVAAALKEPPCPK